MDKRRRHYAAMDVWFAFSDTFDRLHQEFGPGGPLAWLLMIAAAKRAPIQGELTFVSPDGFWTEIGYPDDGTRPELTTLLTLLGRLKQTSKTPFGRRLHVILTNFEAWQELPDRAKAAERSRRKREQNSRDDKRTKAEPNENHRSTETRGDDPKGSLTSQGVGADASTDAAPADARGLSVSPAANGIDPLLESAQAYVNRHAWEVNPDTLAIALMDEFPDLTDEQIHQLVNAAQPQPEPEPVAAGDTDDIPF